jgi:DNA-binding MarR family transcriptional regulator
MEDFVITPHRAKVLSILLREGGAIEDASGQATPLLRVETGHRHTNSLSGVLGQMEKAGLIQRDVNGRRTYRIALTKKGRDLAEQLGDEGAAERIEQRFAPIEMPEPTLGVLANGTVDLDLLAGVLLKKALNATQSSDKSAELHERLRRSEERAERAVARVAALEAELVGVRSRLSELEAINKTLEHNNTLLANQMDKVRKAPGTPIKELISKTELRNLDSLMRQLPTARG